MPSNQPTGPGYLKALGILHLALIAGQVMFGVIAVFLRVSGEFNPAMPELTNIFIYLVPALMIGAIFAGNTIFTGRLSTLRAKTNFAEKLNDYRAALLLRYALLEGPSILAIIAYLVTGELLFICISGIIIIIFFILRPSKEKITKDLELSNAETDMLG